MEALDYKTSRISFDFEEAFLRRWAMESPNVEFLSGACFLELQKFADLNGFTLDVRNLENPDFPVREHFMVDAYLRRGDEVWTSFGDGATIKQAWETAIFELCERFFFDLQRRSGFEKGFYLSSLEMADYPCRATSSNGVACHNSPQQSAAAAILEVIERDAFMCHWLTGRPMTLLRTTDLPEVQAFADLAEQTNLRFGLYSLRAYGDVPTVMAASWSERNKRSFLSIGTASALTLGDATRKAMREMIRLQSFSHSSYFDRPADSLESAMGRSFFYQKEENFQKIRRFFEENITRNPKEKADSERDLTSEQVLDLGRKLEAILYPIRGFPGLSDKLFTCWAHVPRLQGLSFQLDAEINSPRLIEFMEGTAFTLNKEPHPLA